MLVLARRQNEKIVFPHLGITVEILRIAGNAVRLGIDAPQEISVLREEVAARIGKIAPPAPHNTPEGLSQHALRNRLNSALLALHLLERQLDAGLLGDAEQTLSQALRDFSELDQQLSPANSSPSSPSKRRALLVEDDANESKLLASYLRLSGFSVDTVDDGEAALDYLSAHERPDVVLLDMMMPRLNGSQTISVIRSTPAYRGLKVFAVSGTEPRQFGVPTGPAGVDRWFAKPLDPELLVKQLERDLVAV